MKVKCINKKGWMRDDTKEKVDGPDYNEVCDVIETVIHPSGLLAYGFTKWTEGPFVASEFIQLDGGIPDADTINEQEKESIVPNPQVHPIFQDILKTIL